MPFRRKQRDKDDGDEEEEADDLKAAAGSKTFGSRLLGSLKSATGKDKKATKQEKEDSQDEPLAANDCASGSETKVLRPQLTAAG